MAWEGRGKQVYARGRRFVLQAVHTEEIFNVFRQFCTGNSGVQATRVWHAIRGGLKLCPAISAVRWWR